ncbi:MAG: hypothetical protein KBB13_00690 [Anaerolineaceae bacterium]|nr:hypothetical protein [Anaerolineaceae bacterium]
MIKGQAIVKPTVDFRRYFPILVIVLLLISGTGLVLSKTKQITTVELLSPAGCPLDGCAAGQRLNMRLSFPVEPIYTSAENVMVCVTSTGGSDNPALIPFTDYATGTISQKGLVSNVSYSSIENCGGNSFAGENLVVSVQALHTVSVADQLNLALRLNKLAVQNGSIRIHVFEKDASGAWFEQSSALLALNLAPSQVSTAYVAADSGACSLKKPCFINSGDDLSGGLGTGLKDALDALPNGASASPVYINILGTYPIKSNEVLVNRPFFVLQGTGTSVLTSTGSTCSAPMLGITSQVTVQKLSINDGECNTVSRNLLRVNSSLPVTIQNNTLQQGAHAIIFEDNSGNLLVQFNHITNNIGNAIRRIGFTGTGSLKAVANNILNNAWSTQVECGTPSLGLVDHNYWGPGLSPETGAANCAFSQGSQLGAAIMTQQAGVSGQLVQVTTTATSLFGSALTVSRSAGEDYWLYVVDHGQGVSSNVPFVGYGTDPITPCGSFYDIFLGSTPGTSADLVAAFKYNLNSSCQAAIESQTYCGQPDTPQNYPLWWFDPKASVTDKWDKVGEAPQGSGAGGASGQAVQCDLNLKTITMTLDTTGRPNLTQDLNQTPFIVGLPLPLGVQLTQEGFTGAYKINQADLTWTTLSENNVGGFHILRSENNAGPFFRISGLIPAVGNPFLGGIYTYTDTTVQFGKTYYYKLEVVDSEGLTIQLFGPVTINSATQTPTTTLTLTPTHTLTPTRTGSVTLTPTRTNTRTSTPTRTPYVYRSPTSRYQTNTPVIVRTATSRFPTPTGLVTGTQTGFPSPMPTQTGQSEPYPIGTPAPVRTEGSPAPDINFTQTVETSATNEVVVLPTNTATATDVTGGQELDKTDRYQTRVLWVVPLLVLLTASAAGLFIWWKRRKS